MDTKYYNSEVGWHIYAIIPFFILCCMLGGDYVLGLLFSIPICVLISILIATTKYTVRGQEFGVKYLFRWHWFPIVKIDSIRQIHSIVSAPALSTHRIAIKFSDRKILKSFAPLEISPKDRDGFINALLKVNPDIKVDV